MASLPARPRLAAHVLARRHLVGGEPRVVLHDLATGRLVQIGQREWGLLAAADGTRDVEGIVLAAAREGAHARAAAVRGFLEQLHAAGMVEDGVEDGGATGAPAAPAPAEPVGDGGAPDLTRPLDPLPGFSLHCDGSGSCCRFYATVLFGPVEAARARATLPQVLDGGARHERVFLPEHGSGPTGAAAVTYVDGGCAYLGGDGRCALHAAEGPAAKPLGCRTYPATFVDDGEAVRVSVAVECACVLASVDRPGGAPLLPEGARVRGDLDETLVIDPLPEHILVTPDLVAPRAAFVAWSRAVAPLLATAADPARALLALAAAVDAVGLDPAAAASALGDPPPVPSGRLRPWAEALSRRAARRAREDASFRAERDLVLRAAGWLAAASAALAEGDSGGPPTALRSERFYLEALLHGHRLAGGRPVSIALRDRAVRLLVARALAAVLAEVPEPERDPAAAHPLALVEAMLRGHGLDAYVEDVTDP